MDRQEEQWVSVFDLSAPNQETEVDFISFQPLLGPESSVVIGWADEYMNDKCAVVYRYDGSSLSENFSVDYDYLSFTDLNNDGQLDMVAVTCHPFYEELTVSFITKTISVSGKSTLDRCSTLELPYNSAEVVAVQTGMVDSSTPALFLDSRVNPSRGQTMMVTQVVSAYGRELVNLLDSGETILSEMTLRPTSTLCQDIDGDGIMEVPSVSPLPGYEEEEEVLYLTTFNQLGVGRTWQPVLRCAINEDHRYRITFPESWLDTVTIVSQPESSEWSFIRYNGTLEDTSVLLLRLKVYSVKDYHDKFESEYFRLLGQQGLFEYYAHIPESDDPLVISEKQLQELFAFLG